ncbi:MAG: hypothetical protein FD170_2457 [Bacteroidetes bacterium]|nr:MAG: hypothetical protein FD170_2457 [Bacteroidota bacterium]
MKRLYLLLIFVLLLAEAQAQFKALSPAQSSVIPNNMPTLSWTAVECDHYEITINRKIKEIIPARVNYYVPFALPFGENHWEVKAIQNGSVKGQVASSFTVDDRPLNPIPERAKLLRENWKIQSAWLVKKNGKKLSTPDTEVQDWHSTTLPSTVLTALVRNGLYPNPCTHKNNMLIPDMNDIYNKNFDLLKYSHIPGKNPWKKAWWYRNEFEAEKADPGKKVWLNIDEINYRAEVWLNGTLLGSKEELVGMERNFRFDVTNLIKSGRNVLAIAIYPPDHPGEPVADPVTPLADPGQNMADGMLSRDYTKWDALGWDWQPPVRDRDMGITEDVYLSYTDALEISNVYITSNLPLPDTSSAALTLSFDLVNHGSAAIKGVSKLIINGKDKTILLEIPYDLSAGSTKSFLVSPETHQQLLLSNPELWWPHGYGAPNLYSLSLKAVSADGGSAYYETRFGIREISSYIGKNERVFNINGRDIYIRAGNWVIDMMLNWTSNRYSEEIRLSKHAGLNLLRIWGPTGVPPRSLYQAADEQGVMLWQDFLNDFWGTFKNTPGYQPEISLFETASAGIVRKLRNHPSLIIWCGGNEGINPREELLTGKVLPENDGRDTRYYLKASDGDGLHGGGPYHTLEPDDYFTHEKLHGFSSEIGASGIPVAESVQKFMPLLPESWAEDRFPLDGYWAFHDANNWPGEDTRKFSAFDDILRNSYGAPKTHDVEGVLDYLDKCQLISYEVYRAAIESINHQLWENSSGYALWKSNSSWPSMVWQVYDWYLQAHAGFYSTRKSNSGINLQYNRDNRSISLISTGNHGQKELLISAESFGTDLKTSWKQEVKITHMTDRAQSTGWTVPESGKMEFLRLRTTSITGELIQDKLYWLSPDRDFTALSSLPEPELQVSASEIHGNDRKTWEVTITNTGESLAFMTALSLRGENSGTEILPSIWSDNYISLLPGESRTLTVEAALHDVHEAVVIGYRPFIGTLKYFKVL